MKYIKIVYNIIHRKCQYKTNYWCLLKCQYIKYIIFIKNTILDVFNHGYICQFDYANKINWIKLSKQTNTIKWMSLGFSSSTKLDNPKYFDLTYTEFYI